MTCMAPSKGRLGVFLWAALALWPAAARADRDIAWRDAQRAFERARSSDADDDYRRALDFIQKLPTDMFATRPDLCYVEAECCYRLGEYIRAQRRFAQALELKPDFAEAHVGLALSLLRAGDPEAGKRAHGELELVRAQALGLDVIGVLHGQKDWCPLLRDADFILKILGGDEQYRFEAQARRDFFRPALRVQRAVTSDVDTQEGKWTAEQQLKYLEELRALYQDLQTCITGGDTAKIIAALAAVKDRLRQRSQLTVPALREQAQWIDQQVSGKDGAETKLRLYQDAQRGMEILGEMVAAAKRAKTDPQVAVRGEVRQIYDASLKPFLNGLAEPKPPFVPWFEEQAKKLLDREGVEREVAALGYEATAIIMGAGDVKPSDVRPSCVLREKSSGRERAYREGDYVQPGLYVRKILRNKVLCSYKGAPVTIFPAPRQRSGVGSGEGGSGASKERKP